MRVSQWIKLLHSSQVLCGGRGLPSQAGISHERKKCKIRRTISTSHLDLGGL